MLLSRDDFRNKVFSRDNNKCVFCEKPAKDAHHILERRLFSDGGYYLNNGASVCEEHHIKCETTEISVENVRLACGITKPVLPEHFYHDQIYDKWGNIILENGQRLKSELFFDESVQKILEKGKVLNLFTNYVKYPRTYHLPWSGNMNEDDRMHKTMEQFHGKRVIVTMKMDGENTTMYSDYIHARSIDGRHHYTRDWVKNFWSTISYNIPEGWRICGENLFAKHSIFYYNLPTYFMGFSIWNEKNVCLDWDSTKEYFQLLDIEPVPIIYDGIYDEKYLIQLSKQLNRDDCEGYVLRIADEIQYKDFKTYVGKYVRENHVQTVKHWLYGNEIEQNKLK